jgi:thiol-disulfide isomerase/thioredoxin
MVAVLSIDRRAVLLAALGAASGAWAHQLLPWNAARPAPTLSLSDLNGKVWDLPSLQGHAVLLNFWATWCEPCKDELPSIERLRVALAGKPFAVLAVEMEGSARTASDTAEELRLHFPMLLDRDSSATSAWNVNLLPTTFLIGPDGAVALSHVGEVDWSSSEWRRKVEALLPKHRSQASRDAQPRARR